MLSTDDQPYPSVYVFPTTNPYQVTVTNARGAFKLQVLTPSALSLRAEYLGLGSSQTALTDYLN